MQYPTLPAEKFEQLLTYLDTLGIDPNDVLAAAGLVDSYILQQPKETSLPAVHYSRLYKCAVTAMQAIDSRVPWAGGLGTDAFEMLCRAIIGSGTLREALVRAERFSAVLEPVTGSRISIDIQDAGVALYFFWKDEEAADLFAPVTWYRREGASTVAQASGLVVWHGLLSWLIGHSLHAERVEIAGAAVSDGYTGALGDALAVTPVFDAPATAFYFSSSTLDFRIVQNQDSLEDFLNDTVLQLIRIEQQPASVSESVKRLMGNDFSAGVCSFADVAERLYMSESSLRRRLLEEQTSFQALKDEVRCQLAKTYLSDPTQKIGDVAERLGFTEQSSFGRSFRQWTGVTPGIWRDQLIASQSATDGERCCS